MEKAKREKKSLELARVTRSYIEGCKTNSQIRNKEMRIGKDKSEKEKRERLKKVKKKKLMQRKEETANTNGNVEKDPTQIERNLGNGREKTQEIRITEDQNLWRKWRG